jgi:hypothetical protein
MTRQEYGKRKVSQFKMDCVKTVIEFTIVMFVMFLLCIKW